VTEALGVLAACLPKGILNVVTGKSAEIGDTLTLHPDVAKIGFTGGIPAARKIMANAAQGIKNVTLELGGNDAAIIMDDADLTEESMQRMARGTFAATGQVCMAIKRVYVHESIASQFMTAFSNVVDKYVIGDGLMPGVTMGPMHSQKGRNDALALIADSKQRGASITSLGKIANDVDFSEGYFVRPTLVTNIDDGAPLVKEEQFCPVLPVMTFKTVEDAVARANNSIFGLCASIWSKNIDQALSLARQMEAGTVFVNTHGVASVNRKAPYGGIKQSGIGNKAGLEGVKEYLQIQTITTFEA
jgi:acyl-CoA reductase-like NAD-dependent aldehyde dehydrogenase